MAPGRLRHELLVAGHVNVDRFLRVARFPPADRTVPVVGERVELGGTATGLARVARRCGVGVGLLARIGDGFPREFERELRRAGIDLRGLERVRGSPTPTCLIVEEATGATRTLIQQGPMGAEAAGPLPGAWWRAYRWLHLGTGPPARSLALARAARSGGRHVSLDPAQEIFYRWDRATFQAALSQAEILFGNRAEIEHAGTRLSRGGIPSLLEKVPLIVRTEGPVGATAFYRGGEVRAAARSPRRRRTLVGAGDAFRGGFYGAWFAGADLAACLAAGNRQARARIEGRRA
jgi:sugar/nucleoside kinase (ribokinase family)